MSHGGGDIVVNIFTIDLLVYLEHILIHIKECPCEGMEFTYHHDNIDCYFVFRHWRYNYIINIIKLLYNCIVV
jgi:hypothetical protein